jgi:hypothetical protein
MTHPQENARRVRRRPSIKTIARDENRREEAERDLVEGLRSYINKLPEAKDRDAIRETEIFCGYAREDYDSSSEAFLDGRPSTDPKALFEIGDFSEPQVLIGWPTIDRVRKLVKRVTVPRPAHWPVRYHPDDSLETRRLIREIFQSAPETFEWLLETPWATWFDQQLQEFINECVRAKREEYELRFPKPPEQNEPARLKPTVVVNPETRKRRYALLKKYRTDNGINSMGDLARHFALSVTAIQGMVRSDRKRYSEEKLATFLKSIGVSPSEW